jgi:transposase-like protein
MKFKSLPQLLDFFKDEAKCTQYFEQMVWGGNPVCPHCKAEKPYKTKVGYKCSNNQCYKKFTVKVGTILENSKIPLRMWFAAIFLTSTHKRGINSVQLATDLGVTQKTAWFMLHRIREMMKDKEEKPVGDITGIVEVDEAYIGGTEQNRHRIKRQNPSNPGFSFDGKPYNFKKIVIGIIERGGNVVLKHVPDVIGAWSLVNEKVIKNSTIVTDKASIYNALGFEYDHHTINHSKEQYVDGDVHTNTIENYWSVLKRTIDGTYIQVSKKHLQAYLNESSARFNTRQADPVERLNLLLSNSKGSCMYKVLTAKD